MGWRNRLRRPATAQNAGPPLDADPRPVNVDLQASHWFCPQLNSLGWPRNSASKCDPWGALLVCQGSKARNDPQGQWLAMPWRQQPGAQRRHVGNGVHGQLPVPGGVPGRSSEIRRSRQDSAHRVQVGGYNRIPSYQDAIPGAPVGNMSGGVTRRRNGNPTRQTRHFPASREALHDVGDIARGFNPAAGTGWQRPQKGGNEPPVQRHRKLGNVPPGSHWHFCRVDVNRHVPHPRQGAGSTRVVRMDVRQENGGGPVPGAEHFLHSPADRRGAARPSAVNHRPGGTRADKVEI